MTSRYDTTLPTTERKRHGVFYTPDPIVRYLVQATAPAGPVIDLSCGDGAFLVEAARCGVPVMGVDRDRRALQQAEANLAAFPPEQWQLRHGDGLSARLRETPDVVLGNPPYLEAKKADPKIKARCRKRFADIIHGGFDVFVCFLKAGLDRLAPGGRLGYIVPNKFLIADYARPLRELLLRTTTIEEVIDVSDIPTFRDAAVYPVMLVLRKSPPPPGHLVRTGQVHDLAQLDSENFPTAMVQQSHWEATSRRVFWLPPVNPIARQLVDRLMADTSAVPLAQLLDIRWTVSFHRGGLRDEFIFAAPTGANPRRLLGGKRFHGNADVRRFRTAWSGWWIDYDEERAKAQRNQFPPLSHFTATKILIAQNARRIVATLDEEGYVCKDTFLLGLQRSEVPLPYLLGVLNSALLSYLYSILFKATHVGGAYLHYLSCYLDDLPIRLASDTTPIITLVQRLLDPTLTEADRMATDRALDEAVFDLYELSLAERQLISEAIPYAWGEDGARRGAWDARKCANDAQM